MLGWRDTPVQRRTPSAARRAPRSPISNRFSARRGRHDAGRAGAQALRGPPARRSRGRREATSARSDFFYVPSLSSRTIVYKGLLLAPQIADSTRNLRDPETRSALCLVHQRFSTNTFPTWQLAHPYRYHLPQRRNQHRARQRELDERARVGARIGSVRRRHSRRFSR